jgi:hypothetical protein
VKLASKSPNNRWVLMAMVIADPWRRLKRVNIHTLFLCAKANPFNSRGPVKVVGGLADQQGSATLAMATRRAAKALVS